MTYHLRFQGFTIATVEEDDADFPTYFGHFILSPEIHTPALAHVLAYIDYSVRTWPLVEADRFHEIDFAEEEKFQDLIDSNDWALINVQTGASTPILIPNFCTGQVINWRLQAPGR